MKGHGFGISRGVCQKCGKPKIGLDTKGICKDCRPKPIMEPLIYLGRKDLQLNIMRNIEKEIRIMSRNAKLRVWWDNSSNWVKVQTFLNQGSMKAGSTSSIEQCLFLGIDPDGKTFY